MIKSYAHISESIERFRSVFWEKCSGDRPPVGVVASDVFLPIKYMRGRLPPVVLPEQLGPQTAQADYEFVAIDRKITCDDWMPFAAPWRAVPWIEAACGCSVRYASGSMAPEHFVVSLEQLAELPLPAGKQWLDLMYGETTRLDATMPDDCWISPSILRGPSDVLAAMRGLNHFYCDLYDDIELVKEAAARINQVLLKALKDHFAIVRPKQGGYGHIYGYWAPGPTVVIQEDVLGMSAPSVYREHFHAYNAQIVEQLGDLVLFHMHSTGCHHWRDVLAIEGISGIELTIESNGPALSDLMPMLREILERSRLIRYVDHGSEQLAGVVKQLPHEGLYLLMDDGCFQSDEDFQGFISAAF